MPLFQFEELDVYRVGRELNREITGIVAELPRGAGEAADNLRRAGLSITRNVAELNGRRTAPDRVQRAYIARGSAMEVGASLDELVDCGFVAPGRVTRAKSLASRIVSMIMGLIRALLRNDPSGEQSPEWPDNRPAEGDSPAGDSSPETGGDPKPRSAPVKRIPS